jgi:methyl-accepting chemotaxis protein
MLTKPQIQTGIPERQSNTERTVRPALFGVRSRIVTLAIAPVLLAGSFILFSVISNVTNLVNGLYETQTNQMVRVLMGNIDFSNPKEIGREFQQAMHSSSIMGMHLTQTDVNGKQSRLLVFRDEQAESLFKTREPSYAEAVSQGAIAESEYFANLSFQNTSTDDWVLRGTGLGGHYGATKIEMRTPQDESKLVVPTATKNESGFSLVVIADEEKLGSHLRNVGYIIIGSIVAALLLVAGVASFVAQSIVRPLSQLTVMADAMSTGDLETPIEIKSRDELGKLGDALERTRLSLRLAIERTQRKRAERAQQ